MDNGEVRLIFETIAPYLSNHPEISLFLKKNGHIERERLIGRVEERVKKHQGTLRTDYKILLNKLVEI